ncbi:hypothetical protein ACIOMR_14020 [Pseudomonas sp. NPDC087814]|uniref:hypothetical protein n=1 Tax=Pseudomonas sp. NPDC087814 TaxID=3364450 RepID=UPI0037FB44AE
MSLKALFEEDELDPKREALDLMTSYHSTIRFLEYFQAAIFDREQQHRSLLSVYRDYLYDLGLINTHDDYPRVVGGRADNPNEKQAIRNLKFPMGLGSLAAYMSINLGIAKEIASDKIPNKISDKLKSDWYFSEFDIIEDEAVKNPPILRVVTRLRNAVSHHNFKLRIPLSLIHESDIKDQVEVTFYDKDPKGKEFFAKARFRVVEKLMEKLRSSVYSFHTCPVFDGDISKHDAITNYVAECFEHFSRSYAGKGLKFEGVIGLSPEDAIEVIAKTGYFEISKSDCLMHEVRFSLNGKKCDAQYIDIPYIGYNRWGNILIEDELYPMGEYPMEWMLTHEKSPLCRLDKKIVSMLDLALASRTE